MKQVVKDTIEFFKSPQRSIDQPLNGQPATEVKDTRLALKGLGVLTELHGERSGVVMVIDPVIARELGERLIQVANEAEEIIREEYNALKGRKDENANT